MHRIREGLQIVCLVSSLASYEAAREMGPERGESCPIPRASSFIRALHNQQNC